MTAEEIRSITFEKGVRGYKAEDVDDFLLRAAETLEAALAERDAAIAARDAFKKEAAESRQKMVVLAQKIEEYRAEESALKNAMIEVQKLKENALSEAQQRAASIVKRANMDAEILTQQSREDLVSQKAELERAKTEVARFKNEVLGLYKAHIELLSKVPGAVEEAPEAAPAEEPSAPAEPAPAEPPAAPAESPAPAPAEEEEILVCPFEEEETEEKEEPAAVPQPDFSGLRAPVEDAAPMTTPKPVGFDSFQGISFDD